MGSVIKVDAQNPAMLRRLETITISDHVGEARMIVEKSRLQARAMLDAAHAEASAARGAAEETHRAADERGFQSGFRRGYAAGQQAGEQTGREQAFAAAQARFADEQTLLVAALTAAVESFEKMKHGLRCAARQDVLEFAVTLAGKVAGQFGAVNREAVISNLEAALGLVDAHTNLVLRVHPADRAAVTDFAAGLGERMAAAEHFRVEEDERISPGGCVLATPEGEVDARIETQIAQIASLLVAGAESET